MTRIGASPSKNRAKSRAANTPASWQQYVRAPSSTVVTPVGIVANETIGNVTNPDALLTSGGALTILSRENSSSDIPTVVVDFGQDVVGFLQINFAGATSNGPGIRLAFSETIEYLTNISDFSRSDNGDTITPGSDQISVPSTPMTWVDTHGCAFNGTQVCADGLHGFRYVKIYLDALAADAPHTEDNGTVLIDSVSLNWSAFLGTPDTFTGFFECSDTQLNQFWFDASYTNEMCIDTFRANDTDPRNSASPTLIGKTVIFDGAKRDRDPYVGDLAVSARTAYLTHNISEAVRNILADLGDHQRADGWIPPASINNYTLTLLDYPLWWVTCSYDYYIYTGDTNYVETYYNTMIRVLDDFYPSITDNTTGLVTKGLGVSGGYGDYAFLSRNGAVTYYNALYVLALNNAASIATFLGGHDSDATRWTSRAQSVAAAINTNNFDSSVGAYLDSPTDAVSHPQDGNGLSIISGVANSTRALSSLSYLSENTSLPYGNAFYDNDSIGANFSQRVYAFISYFDISARFLTGIPDSALEEIRRLYGWMSSQDPGITFWEGIGPGGSKYEAGFTSAAHGWSTGVVPALTNYVLGVIPTGPGFSTWTVKPMPGDLTFANGQVNTPSGPLTVSWSVGNSSDGFAFQLMVSAPLNTSGTVSVPVSDGNATISVDSQPMESTAVVAGYATVQVTGGQHNVTVGK